MGSDDCEDAASPTGSQRRSGTTIRQWAADPHVDDVGRRRIREHECSVLEGGRIGAMKMLMV